MGSQFLFLLISDDDDDDDDDDNDGNDLLFVVSLTNKSCLILFTAGSIVRDPHHR